MGALHYLSDQDRTVLRYLRRLAEHGGGYERGGVRGWAAREDVERGTGEERISEKLPRLHAGGLLDRVDARAPGLERPFWIWRIAREGSRVVSETEGLPPWEVPPPPHPPGNDRTVYLPPDALAALYELRRAREALAESPHLPGEPGWRTVQELWAQAAGEEGPEVDDRRGRHPWRSGPGAEPEPDPDDPAEWLELLAAEPEGWDPLRGGMPPGGPPRTFSAYGLEWLVRRGLAQRWSVREEGRRPLVLYRITPLGAGVVPLRWREPDGGPGSP